MSARHWQGTEQAHLGGWLLRAGGGFTGRANSALPLGEPGMPAERAVDEVEAWYRRRGLKPMIVIATGLGGDGDALDHLLARRGWPRRQAPVLVMTAGPTLSRAADGARRQPQPPPPRHLAPPSHFAPQSQPPPPSHLAPPTQPSPPIQPPPPHHLAPPNQPAPRASPRREPALAAEPVLAAEMVFADEPDEDWLAAYRYGGQRLPPHALPVLLSAPVQVFASVRRDGRTIATGRLSVADGWGGLTAIEVDPACRRTGLGTAVTAGLAAQAAARGAERIFLQVEEGNAVARALYVRCGFAGRHRYHYRIAPG